MHKNPVLVFITGLAAVVDAILACFVLAGSLDGALAAQIGIAQTLFCALVAATLRARMDSPDTVDKLIVEALRRSQVAPHTPPHAMEAHVRAVRKSVEAHR